jgi:hypothetical protein
LRLASPLGARKAWPRNAAGRHEVERLLSMTKGCATEDAPLL